MKKQVDKQTSPKPGESRTEKASMSPLDSPVSVYRCAISKKPLPPMTLREVFGECRTMKVTDSIKKLRQLKVKKDSASIHKLKQNSLKAFCALGMFTEEGHQAKYFIQESYTGVIPVDIDEPADREKTIEQLATSPHFLGVGRSPGGIGIKAFFLAPPIFKQHEDNVVAVAKEVKSLTGYEMERPEINRLTFFFPDPKFRWNLNGAMPIKVTPKPKKKEEPSEEPITDADDRLKRYRKIAEERLGKIGEWVSDKEGKTFHAQATCPRGHDDAWLYLNPDGSLKLFCVGEEKRLCYREVQFVNEWFERELEIGKVTIEDLDFEGLMAFDPSNDPDNLIGRRWFVRGSTSLWAGTSGAGKSTLAMQAAIYWANGLAMFGIKPVRPLKSLISQSEDDAGDVAEQMQGVLKGIAANERDIDEARLHEVVKQNVIIRRVYGITGQKFCILLEKLISEHKPDLVWINPLFAFAGCSLMDPEKTGQFLRDDLFPVAWRTGVVLNVIHHAGKTDRDSKAKEHWTDLDFQYLGFGSSEIQNAFRAVNILTPAPKKKSKQNAMELYRLILSKRGGRAEATTPSEPSEVTTRLYLIQATGGSLFWSQVEEPSEEPTTSTAGKRVGRPRSVEGDQLLKVLGEKRLTYTEWFRRVQKKFGISESTFKQVRKFLEADGEVDKDEDGKYYHVGIG